MNNYSSIRSAMFMAAGLGTRMRPFSDRLPKPLFPILGIPAAQFALDRLAQAGVTHVVANVHHLADIMRQGLMRLENHGIQIEFSDETQLLLGSAGGLRCALERLGGGSFFLINGDVLMDVDLTRLAMRHSELRQQYGVGITLTVFNKSPAKGEYREVRVDPMTHLITGLGQKGTGVPFFASAAVIESELIKNLPPGKPLELVPEILEPAIRRGQAGAYVTQGWWYDIGSPELWLETHTSLIHALETGAVPELWRTRIEKENRRVANGVWVSKQVRTTQISPMNWNAPAYWSPNQDTHAQAPQGDFGPQSVCYGSSVGPLENGICFDGVCVKTS